MMKSQKSHVVLGVVCASIGFAAASLVMRGGALTVNAEGPGENRTFSCEAPPCDNGDVNADGEIDIADCLYLLTYLFLDGPEPMAIQCVKSGGLLATGQASCYDAMGNVIDCASEQYPGQDGLYRAGRPLENRFVDNGDGTLTDGYTGLMWTKKPADQTMAWQQALQFCENLELGIDPETEEFYDDWRLPNINELYGLCRFDRQWPSSAFDSAFVLPQGQFDPVRDWFYWSSTTYKNLPEYAWVGTYAAGALTSVDWGRKTRSDYRVLAVRGGL